MLDAIRQKKTKVHLRYLGHREEGERRVCEEDEITSTIFGPMALLPAHDVLYFWKRIIIHESAERFFPENDLQECIIKLWPSSNSGIRVEPDILITFKWRNGEQRHLLVEIKWRSPLSSDDQLQDQWLHFLSDDQQRNSLHLFIAREVSEGVAARARKDVWTNVGGRRLLLISWARIRSTTGLVMPGSSGFSRWAELTNVFLSKLNIGQFVGFKEVRPPDFSITRLKPLFWSENQRVGIDCIADHDPLSIERRSCYCISALFWGCAA